MRVAILAVIAGACGPATAPVAIHSLPPPGVTEASAAPQSQPQNDDAKAAAIQLAMNQLAPVSQQCWAAAAAAQRFDIEGSLTIRVEVGAAKSTAAIVTDTTRNAELAACMVELLSAWHWPPPLPGQTLQMPFAFHAPDGQSVIDRRLVPWKRQDNVSVAVLLDEMNTGNPAASMFEITVAAGSATGLRKTQRAELWYFLGPAEVSTAGMPHAKWQAMSAGDMMYVPAQFGVREVRAKLENVHAVIVAVPGGREGAARAGALPTPSASSGQMEFPIMLPAAAAKTFGPATIFAEPATIHDKALAASILALPAGAKVPEHVHANETEMLYVLEGAGTLTIAGTDVEVEPTSAVQIPPNTKHAFVARDAVRAVQIYTPAGPEQRFKK